MTIQDALTMADTMRPNRIDDEQKIMWLSQLDGIIWNDLVVTHEIPQRILEQYGIDLPERKSVDVLPNTPADQIIWGQSPWDVPKEAFYPPQHIQLPDFPGYGNETDRGTELLVQPPYHDLYLHWLLSRIDMINQEYDLYQNDAALFNNAYLTYQDYYNRTYVPNHGVTGFRM